MVGFEGENENRFSRGTPLSLKVTVALIGSLVLMIIDQRFNYISNMRDALAVVTYPIEAVASFTGDVADQASDDWSSREQLEIDVAALQAEKLELEVRVQRLEVLEQENDQLRQTLSAARRQSNKVKLVKVVGVSGDVFRHRARINLGSRAGVYVGQPVIDAHGIAGQVTKVTPFRADVTLIIDGDHSTPVKVKSTGTRATADGGHDNGLLVIRNLAVTADLHKGSVILSSGEGGVFPSGYRVGTVVTVQRDQGRGFARAIVKPAARFDQLEHLLLVWTEQAQSESETESAGQSEILQ